MIESVQAGVKIDELFQARHCIFLWNEIVKVAGPSFEKRACKQKRQEYSVIHLGENVLYTSICRDPFHFLDLTGVLYKGTHLETVRCDS